MLVYVSYHDGSAIVLQKAVVHKCSSGVRQVTDLDAAIERLTTTGGLYTTARPAGGGRMWVPMVQIISVWEDEPAVQLL